MKRLVLISAMTIMGFVANAQTYRSFPISQVKEDNDKAVIYYNIPQTQVEFEVKVQKTIRTKGVYCQNAYMLGIKNVITSDEVRYNISDIKIKPKAVSNPSQVYALFVKEGVNVKISEIGTLCEISPRMKIHPQSIRDTYYPSLTPKEIQQKEDKQSEAIATKPIYETRLLKMRQLEKVNMSAEEVVKKIEALREKQIDILSGGLDGTFINTTIDFMYKQIDEIIDGYVSLFTGVETTIEQTYTYSLNPQKPIIPEEDLVMKLCRFSETSGLSAAEISSDMPILMARFQTTNTTKNIQKLEEAKQNNLKQQEKLAKKGTGVYYAIPENVRVSVEFNNKVFENTIEITQYGIITNLNTKESSLKFNPQTGGIKTIGL